MIRLEKYQHQYYQTVCDFLSKLNKEGHKYDHWCWARFEWMYEHPLTKKELLDHMGLWFDDDHLVGTVLFDMYFGEAFVATLNDYQYLYKEVLTYAFDNLKDDQGLGVAVNELNDYEIIEMKKQGYFLTEGIETVCEINLDKEFDTSLPDGYCIEAFDAEENQEEMSWLMYQGFNNGNDKEEFLQNFQKTSQKRPHFNKNLCILIRNKDGEAVATASTWYDKNVDFAYVEPVCVIPSCRKMGLGKVAVYQALNNAKKLGAKRGIVISDIDFYKRLGFKVIGKYPFYWKKEERTVNGVTYKLDKLLGKGKGGYSYLAKVDDKEYVLKQIHHEPCDYYKFGNKIEAELNDYKRLLNAGIRIPKMIDVDKEKEIIIKEYIDGKVISDLLNDDQSVDEYIPQVEEMARLAKEAGLNIDYYPTNFVVKDGLLYYIDYECNQYMEEWNLQNWGLKYWKKETK